MTNIIEMSHIRARIPFRIYRTKRELAKKRNDYNSKASARFETTKSDTYLTTNEAKRNEKKNCGKSVIAHTKSYVMETDSIQDSDYRLHVEYYYYCIFG